MKEITLDGFKSYQKRVIVPGFDPQFNAITGLNGSGKSNILDSICFVLGIQNLQQVRCSLYIYEELIRNFCSDFNLSMIALHHSSVFCYTYFENFAGQS